MQKTTFMPTGRSHKMMISPVIITEPGQYVTRCGETVTITVLSRKDAWGHYSNGVEERWDVSGILLHFSESANDIMAKAP